MNDGGYIQDKDMPVGVVYSTRTNTLFITNAGAKDFPQPSEVVLENLSNQDVEFWGATNSFPQEVIADIEGSDIVDTVIDWKARQLVGEGVIYGNLAEGPGGSAILNPLFVPEIDRWLNRTNFNLYSYEAALDFYTFYNANAELERNRLGEFIGIFSKDQSWRRYGKNDPRGMITKAYESATWDKVSDLKDGKKVISLEALDPYYNLVAQIEESKNYRHVMPLRFQTRGRKYYALAPWNGVRASGWLHLAVAIPKMKLRLIEQLMQPPTQIEIHDRYWPRQFGAETWKNANDEQKRKLINQEVRKFEDMMFSPEEAGKPKVLMTGQMDGPKGESLSLWKISHIGTSIPTGAYIEDSQETDYHVVRGLGVDPALVGIAPGKSQTSAGSGSADRVKRTNYLIGALPHGNLLLSMMPCISEVNNWDRDFNGGKPIVWQFRSIHAATLDKSNQASPDPKTNTTENDGAV
jgi:hypothetical protein